LRMIGNKSNDWSADCCYNPGTTFRRFLSSKRNWTQGSRHGTAKLHSTGCSQQREWHHDGQLSRFGYPLGRQHSQSVCPQEEPAGRGTAGGGRLVPADEIRGGVSSFQGCPREGGIRHAAGGCP